MTEQIVVRFSVPAPIVVNLLSGAEVARAKQSADAAQAAIAGFAEVVDLAQADAVAAVAAARGGAEQGVGLAHDAAVLAVGAATQTAQEIAGHFQDLAVVGQVAAQAEQTNARLDNLQASQTSDRIIRSSWTELAALTGGGAGRGAEVLDSDTGSHVDPVGGGSVPNAGIYSWSLAPAGWKRIGSTGLAAKADRSELTAGLAGKATLPGLFTPSTLPEPSVSPQGTMFVADAGVQYPVFSDGLAWRRYSDGSTVAVTAMLLASDGSVPLVDVSQADGRFFRKGAMQTDLAAFLAAAGGVQSGATLTFGPRARDGVNRLVNGDAANGTTGWDQGTGLLSVANGEFVYDGNNTNQPAASNLVSGIPAGRALRVRGKGRRGTSTRSLALFASNSSTGSGSNTTTTASAIASSSDTTREITHATSSSLYVGLKASGSPTVGTLIFDDIVAEEVVPLEGYVPGSGLTVYVDAVSGPALPASDQVLWQADAGDDRNRLRVVWSASDGHLRFVITTTATERASVDLGALAINTRFRLAVAAASADVAISRNGFSVFTAAPSGGIPGLAFLRFGAGASGTPWAGTLRRCAFLNGRQPDEWLESRADLDAAKSIVVYGDSLVAGAGAGPNTSFPAQLATLLGRPVHNAGIGGQGSAAILARVQADSSFQGRIHIFWEAPNTGWLTQSLLDEQAAMVAALKHDRFIVMSRIHGAYPDYYAGQPLHAQLQDLNAQLSSAYPTRYCDVRTPLIASGNGSAGDTEDVAHDVTPRSLRADDIHLTATGYAIPAQTAAAFITARNW
jgi:lysophospholipase L1-like esterase